MPTAAELIAEAASRLSAAGIETARLDAEVLLRHVLGIDRTRLFLRLCESVDAAAADAFQRLLDERLRGAPVAYLTGRREFMGLDFAVGPGVLVPRPETELMVEWALDRLRGRERPLVVDVGTGSGAIILSLAAALGPAFTGTLVGSDRSPAALAYAARNRAALGLEDRVHLVRGDLLTWLGRPADLILANLPYLRPDQVAANPDLRAEPEEALVAGADGLDAIARLLADTARVLARGGALILELDPSQAATVARDAESVDNAADVRVIEDLAGLARFVAVSRR